MNNTIQKFCCDLLELHFTESNNGHWEEDTYDDIMKVKLLFYNLWSGSLIAIETYFDKEVSHVENEYW